jgi:hypothetical protein
MTIALARGIAQLITAVSGMLFLFGFVRDMDGLFRAFTTLQMAETVAFMLPWTLLLCSAFHDLSKAVSREWVFWAGSLLVFGVFFHFNRYAPNTISIRVALRALACAWAMIPHILRGLSFIYFVLCIVAGLVGIYTIYGFVHTFSRDLYAHDFSGAVYQLVFATACITAGGYTIASLFYRARSPKTETQR